MAKIGSPEWFHLKSQTDKYDQFVNEVELLRKKFLDRFSPEKLASLNGKDLLNSVFGDYYNSMVNLLMFDSDYRKFGAAGKYKYTSVVYQTQDGMWHYKESSRADIISENEAIKKASYIRDMLISCTESIKKFIPFSTLNSYEQLENEIQKHFIYQYAWVLKYFQMVYPQYFPGMYADKTIDRCMGIIGLPNQGRTKRLLNVGELSLFIRKCDVHNLVFGSVYAAEWGWDDSRKPPCENADNNYKQRHMPVEMDYFPYYDTDFQAAPDNSALLDEVKEIDDELYMLDLEGEDRDAIVRVRVNQGKFREALLRKYSKCCLCGVDDPSFLRASHIKPWSESEPTEKVDVNNGLLLCPNHDELFDKGFISFDENGAIMISKELSNTNQMFLNVHNDMSVKLSKGNKEYMSYHRDYIFKE